MSLPCRPQGLARSPHSGRSALKKCSSFGWALMWPAKLKRLAGGPVTGIFTFPCVPRFILGRHIRYLSSRKLHGCYCGLYFSCRREPAMKKENASCQSTLEPYSG
jgi:hypothetical protein